MRLEQSGKTFGYFVIRAPMEFSNRVDSDVGPYKTGGVSIAGTSDVQQLLRRRMGSELCYLGQSARLDVGIGVAKQLPIEDVDSVLFVSEYNGEGQSNRYRAHSY